jgi:Lamin Tail Domain
MKKRRRLVGYIFLNILVSAAVTSGLLYYYHRTYPPTCADTLPIATAAPGGLQVDILSIGDPGTAASEVVTLQNSGEEAITLTGWMLKNERGSTFTFPQVTLYPGATLRVHTLSGTNTASDLYWGLTGPAWKSGELAGLYDPQNIVRSFYRIP